jgi:hypothetical protein
MTDRQTIPGGPGNIATDNKLKDPCGNNKDKN